MSFEADLKSHLQNNAVLVALVRDRIYPTIRDEGSAVPAVTYHIIADDPLTNLSGVSGGKRSYRIEIDCWALSYATVLAMYAAVCAQMAVASTTITHSVELEMVIEDYEPDTRLYRRGREFSCWYTA